MRTSKHFDGIELRDLFEQTHHEHADDAYRCACLSLEERLDRDLNRPERNALRAAFGLNPEITDTEMCS